MYTRQCKRAAPRHVYFIHVFQLSSQYVYLSHFSQENSEEKRGIHDKMLLEKSVFLSN